MDNAVGDYKDGFSLNYKRYDSQRPPNLVISPTVSGVKYPHLITDDNRPYGDIIDPDLEDVLWNGTNTSKWTTKKCEVTSGVYTRAVGVPYAPLSEAVSNIFSIASAETVIPASDYTVDEYWGGPGNLVPYYPNTGWFHVIQYNSGRARDELLLLRFVSGYMKNYRDRVTYIESAGDRASRFSSLTESVGEYGPSDSFVVEAMARPLYYEEEIDMSKFNPRIGSELVNTYKLTPDLLRTLVSTLSEGTDFWAQFNTTFYGDGKSSILGCQWFYGIKWLIDTPSSGYLKAGNVVFGRDTTYPLAEKEFVEFTLGSIDTPGYYGDGRDYTN